jgi:alpha-mannosidase
MLRADFMPLVFDDTVLCDIQFGHYGRSTKDGTSLERAQYEICAHKWVDVSNSNYGVALINDCKYGHRVKEGVISLNLLRSPVYPDPSADRGKHVFKYALYPHTGDFKSSDTLCYGYIFNYAPRLADGTVTIPQTVYTNNNSIIIETVKKAELQDAIVIRAYECYGNDTIASFDVSFNVKQAYEADMLENVLNKTNLQSVTFTPFEIKTFVLQL